MDPDPKTWTRSWKVALPLKQHPEYRMFDYACHEGNYGMEEYPRGCSRRGHGGGRSRHSKFKMNSQDSVEGI